MSDTQIQKFNFNGRELDVCRRDDNVFVSVRRVCEHLGINHSGQQVKLRDKPWATGEMIASVAEDGRTRQQFFLHLDSLPMWLATIDANKVKPASRPTLEDFQLHAAKVLRDYFIGTPKTPTVDPRLDTLMQNPERMHSRGELRDDPRQVQLVRALILNAWLRQGVSRQRVEGLLRRQYQVLSYLRIGQYAIDGVVALLNDLVTGRMHLTSRQPRLKGHTAKVIDIRQMNLPHVDG